MELVGFCEYVGAILLILFVFLALSDLYFQVGGICTFFCSATLDLIDT